MSDALATAFSSFGIMGQIMDMFSEAVVATDLTVPLGFGLLIILQFVSGYKVPTRSFYLVISLIMFLISTLVAALLNNAFDQAITSLAILNTARFPITLFILDHMFIYYIILGFAWMFGFYVKSTNENVSSGGVSYFS
jgi:hypothetical protein